MKYLIILSLILTSCATYHQKKIEHHTKKLLSKGVVVPKDTIEVIISDTIIKSFTRNDTTFVEKLVTNTITLEPVVEFKTRWQTKVELRYKTKYIKEKTKQKRSEDKKAIKVTKINNRRNWIPWVLVLILSLAFVGQSYFYRKIP